MGKWDWTPFYSVCLLGNGCWFWIAAPTRESYFGEVGSAGRIATRTATRSGYAADEAAAIAEAKAALHPDAARAGMDFGAYAERYHRDLARRKRLEERNVQRPERASPPGSLHAALHPLRDLGLSWPCTTGEVKARYRRLARAAHPDQGGNHAAFLHLRAVYERALRLVEENGRGRGGA